MNFDPAVQCKFESSDFDGLPGVDLNRNFPVGWGTAKSSKDRNSSKEPCKQTYGGVKAFSEKETQVFDSFVKSNQDEIKFVVNFHSYGNQFIWPYNFQEDNELSSKSPGMMQLFKQIRISAPFPPGVKFGNS